MQPSQLRIRPEPGGGAQILVLPTLHVLRCGNPLLDESDVELMSQVASAIIRSCDPELFGTEPAHPARVRPKIPTPLENRETPAPGRHATVIDMALRREIRNRLHPM
jgi:hypothetical protein